MNNPHSDVHNCKNLLASISEFVDGDLPADLCAELEKHLAECENCRIVVNTMRKTIELYFGIKDICAETLEKIVPEAIDRLPQTKFPWQCRRSPLESLGQQRQSVDGASNVCYACAEKSTKYLNFIMFVAHSTTRIGPVLSEFGR